MSAICLSVCLGTHLTVCLSICLQFDCLPFLQCDPDSKLAASVRTDKQSPAPDSTRCSPDIGLHSRTPDLSEDKWKRCITYNDLLLSSFPWYFVFT